MIFSRKLISTLKKSFITKNIEEDFVIFYLKYLNLKYLELNSIDKWIDS